MGCLRVVVECAVREGTATARTIPSARSAGLYRRVYLRACRASTANMEPCIGLTRRTLLRMIGGALGAPLIGPLLAPIAACGGGPAPEHLTPTPRGVRELAAGPKGTGGAAEPTSAASGVQPLGLNRGERDGVLVL